MQQPLWGTSVGFPKAQLGVDNRGLGDRAGPRAAEAGGHSLQLSVGQPLVVSGWHLETQGNSGVMPWGSPKLHVGGPMIPVCGVIAKRVRLWFWAG